MKTVLGVALACVMAIEPGQTIYVADVLNWRFQVFARSAPTATTDEIHSIGKNVLGLRTKRRMDLAADSHPFQISLCKAGHCAHCPTP
jgi:hypothetical protein